MTVQAIIQRTGELTDLGSGLATIAAITAAGLVGLLVLLQSYTERNIWNYLSRVDGIGIVAIGTSLSVLYAVGTQNFELLRVYGTPIAGVLILVIGIKSERVSGPAGLLEWLTLDDALRAIIVAASLTTLVGAFRSGPQNVAVAEYLAGFPHSGLLILGVIVVIPAKKLQELGDN
ncbi:hypothetical protein AMS69_10240 [Haloarcula rubripromontorii]|uniref:Uncharacterized protein n=1 Tax=Haloarcula rubripromontorii TaxID=1705562 RepID=A0A0M9AJN9_9EURY|nr:hypothetical protein [Haloarcula rubripromontorii]KOX92828.1 hypothetical protein AMS69_10240 [Haloarcula rubripromontorii]